MLPEMGTITLRCATVADAATIHDFICQLAAHVRSLDEVEALPAALAAQLASARPPFECLLAEEHGHALGFALFFPSYSTWRGRPGLYLEELFVAPAERGRGIGKMLLRRLAQLAEERGYARLEWTVHRWNEAAIDFYRSVGAVSRDDWVVFHLSDEALAALGRS
jgi:GNAT superfamily N-acetyltransferase